jgi:putative transposase
MTVSEKAALVRDARDEYGLGPALSALSLARSSWHYQSHRTRYDEKHKELQRPLLAIAKKHPDYGYRRATTELSNQVGRRVNSKVVRKLAQMWGLTVLRRPKAPRPSSIRRTITEAGDRANLLLRMNDIAAFSVLVTDFTELRYAHGKVWLMPILGLVSKLVFGYAVGRRSTTLALRAWAHARRCLRRLGVPVEGLIIHHDRDSVYTSDAWVRRHLIEDKTRLSYALRGARDNSEMESFNGRFKTENGELFAEAETVEQLLMLVRRRLAYYNRERRHSSLGNRTPWSVVQELIAEE